MKQKVSTPIAIVIAAVILLIVFGALWKVYFYKPTYSVEDIAAKYRAAAARMHAPNAAQPAPKAATTP